MRSEAMSKPPGEKVPPLTAGCRRPGPLAWDCHEQQLQHSLAKKIKTKNLLEGIHVSM